MQRLKETWLSFLIILFPSYLLECSKGAKVISLTNTIGHVLCNQVNEYKESGAIPPPVLWKPDRTIKCGKFGWKKCAGACNPFMFASCDQSDGGGKVGSDDYDREVSGGDKKGKATKETPAAETAGKHTEALRYLRAMAKEKPDFEQLCMGCGWRKEIQPALDLVQGFFETNVKAGGVSDGLVFIGTNYGFPSAAEKDEFFRRLHVGLELCHESKDVGAAAVLQQGIIMMKELIGQTPPDLTKKEYSEVVFDTGEDFFNEFDGAMQLLEGLWFTGNGGGGSTTSDVHQSLGDLFGAEDDNFSEDVDPKNVYKFYALQQTGLQYMRGLFSKGSDSKQPPPIDLISKIQTGMEKLQQAVKSGQFKAPGLATKTTSKSGPSDAADLLKSGLETVKGWTSSSTSSGKIEPVGFFNRSKDSLAVIKELYQVGGMALKEDGVKLLHPAESLKAGKRIVGGVDAKKYNYPSIVLVKIYGEHQCSGTIIGSEWVMSAAHCVDPKAPKYYKFVAAEHNKERNEGPEQERKAVKIFVHPKYSTETDLNDIVLFKVSPAFALNDKVKAAKLPSEKFNPKEGTMIWVAGWGRLKENAGTPDILQEVSLPIVSVETCKKKIQKDFPELIITDTQLCAGFDTGGKDACQGDSGGPMYYVKDGKQGVIGVVSWGEGCADKRYPGVYTRVTSYLSWIQSTIDNDAKGGRAVMGPFPKTAKFKYPSTVEIKANGVRICLGSIINTYWVLTAAHCATSFDSSLEVVAGRTDGNDGKEQMVLVQKIVLHEQYNSNTKENDISLLKVAPKLKYTNRRIRQVILPTKGYKPRGSLVSVAWIKSTKDQAASELLETVNVDVVSPKVCADWLDNPELGKQEIVCAGFSNTTTGICQGEDGSPLYANQGGNHYIVGVASWGEICADKNSPRVYTKVSAYLDWIQNNTKELD